MIERGCFGYILVGIILVSIFLMAYVVGSMLLPDQPQAQNTASTRCVGLFNIGSCNVTQTSYRPPNRDISPDMMAGLLVGGVCAALVRALSGGRGE